MKKIKVVSLDEFDNILKGIVKLVPGCCLEISDKGTEVKIGAFGKIRAFIKTTAVLTDEKEPIELCFENVSKLIQAFSFLKDIGADQSFELETDDIFLSYKGKGKFKLKLDKKERVEQFMTTPLKTEFEDLFSFNLNQDQINFIMKYSTLNQNIETIKGYFYLKDNLLYIDIDDKQEARLSSISIPVTDKFEGNLENPVIIDLNDIKQFSLIDKEKIKVLICKQCIRVLSFRKTNETKTAMQMIVRILKA